MSTRMLGLRRQAGMTLIEVVIALVLFSLIALALVTAMSTMGRTLDRSSQRIDEIDQMRLITSFLRRAIGSAQSVYVPVLGAAPPRQQAQFDGKAHALTWVGYLNGHQGPGGVFILSLVLEPSASNHADSLILRIRPWVDPRLALPADYPIKNVLLSRIDQFQLAYQAGDGSQTWLPQWQNRTDYPQAVRVQITVAGRAWPEMVIRLDQANGRSS